MNLGEFWKQSKRIINKGQNEIYDKITEDRTKLENPEEAKSDIREYAWYLYQARPGKPEYEHWTGHTQEAMIETDKTIEKTTKPNHYQRNETSNQTTKTWKKHGPWQEQN